MSDNNQWDTMCRIEVSAFGKNGFRRLDDLIIDAKLPAPVRIRFSSDGVGLAEILKNYFISLK